MKFLAIRIAFWALIMIIPFAVYSIAGINFPPETAAFAYGVAIAGVVVGAVAKLPLRAGADQTMFPVRAASGCWSLLAPVGAVSLVWIIPHVSASTTKLLVLILTAGFILAFLVFATVSGILRETPKP